MKEKLDCLLFKGIIMYKIKNIMYSSRLEIPLEAAHASMESTEVSLPFKVRDREAGGTPHL